MKLGKVTSNDPYIRTTIKLRQSTANQLELYQDYYKKVYGDEITLNTLLEEVARAFLRDDKGFQKFESEQITSLGSNDSPKPVAKKEQA